MTDLNEKTTNAAATRDTILYLPQVVSRFALFDSILLSAGPFSKAISGLSQAIERAVTQLLVKTSFIAQIISLLELTFQYER